MPYSYAQLFPVSHFPLEDAMKAFKILASRCMWFFRTVFYTRHVIVEFNSRPYRIQRCGRSYNQVAQWLEEYATHAYTCSNSHCLLLPGATVGRKSYGMVACHSNSIFFIGKIRDDGSIQFAFPNGVTWTDNYQARNKSITD